MPSSGSTRAAVARLFLILNEAHPHISSDDFEAWLTQVEKTPEGRFAIQFWDESFRKLHARYTRLHAAVFYLLQWLPDDLTKAQSKARSDEIVTAKKRLKLQLEFGWDTT